MDRLFWLEGFSHVLHGSISSFYRFTVPHIHRSLGRTPLVDSLSSTAFVNLRGNSKGKKISTFELKLPQVIFGWLRLCLFLLLGIYFSTQLVAAMAGRTPPFETTAMNYPLPSGSYLVLSGGNHTAINAHLMTLDASVPRFQQWRGQSYALDIVQINNLGFRSAGFLPSDPAEYFIYGTEILAPCDGHVKSAVDGIADNQVPLANREAMTGNHVLISCNGVEVLLAHMIPNSVAVNAQDAVSVGDVLG